MNKPMTWNDLTSTRPLTGRVSLVTGSTSGIGLGIAGALAAAGSAIVLNGFGKAEEISATQAVLSAECKVKVEYSGADMSNPDSIAEMIEMAIAEFGQLDVLVNNAGIQFVAPLQEFPTAKWDAILAINLSSAFHTTRLALPRMIENKWGRIVNIASAHGLVGSPFKSAYVAAKHGILGLTKVTALETAERGITCNAICPGYVYTPLVEAQIDSQAEAHRIPREQVIRDILLAQQPNKRFASVEELGALTVFLASEAASSITGVALPVNGGWNPTGPEPNTIWEVLHRHKDIQYSSRIANHIARQREAHRLRHVISELAKHVPDEIRKTDLVRELAGYGCPTRMHVVRLLAPRLDNESHLKDIDFSPSGIRQRWHAGYADTLRALVRAAWIGEFGQLDAVVLHEPGPEKDEVTIEKLAAAAE